jgi:hypothetical protein
MSCSPPQWATSSTGRIGDDGAIRDGAHGCRGYRKGSRE